MLKALLVVKGTFSSKTVGDYSEPWRGSQLCLGEWLMGQRFDGLLFLPEAQCHFIFTASFVWLVGFGFFFLLFLLLCIYKYVKIKLRFQLHLLPRPGQLKRFLARCEAGHGSLEQRGRCH